MATSLPTNEKLWITILNNDGKKYFITSDVIRSKYYIYDENYKRLGSNASPLELERKYVKTIQI